MGPPISPGAGLHAVLSGWGESVKLPRHSPARTRTVDIGQSVRSACSSLCQPKFRGEPRVHHYDPVIPIGDRGCRHLGRLPRYERLIASTGRRSLIDHSDEQFETVREARAVDRLDKFQSRAFFVLCSARRGTLDLAREPTRFATDTAGS